MLIHRLGNFRQDGKTNAVVEQALDNPGGASTDVSAEGVDGVVFRAGPLIELMLDMLDQKSPEGSGLFGLQLESRLRGK